MVYTKMINKKLTAVSMALTMLISAAPAVSAETPVEEPVSDALIMPVPQTGGSTTNKGDEGMQEALIIVKQRIDIPEEFTEFTYNSYTDYNTVYYSFNWSSNADSYGYGENINVTIAGDIITNYYSGGDSYYDASNPTLSLMGEEKLIQMAKEHFQKINPGIAAQADFDFSHASLFAKEAIVSISRNKNELPVDNNSGSMSLDKNTGELISFHMSWWDNAEFQDIDKAGVLPVSELLKPYTTLCDLIPAYRPYTDPETGKTSAKIVYSPDFNEYIDAVTGKISRMYQDIADDNNAAYPSIATPTMGSAGIELVEDDVGIEESGAGAPVRFTEAERKSIEENEKLLKREEAQALLLKDKYLGLNSEYGVQSSRLYQSTQYLNNKLAAQAETRYFWSFNFAIDNNEVNKNINVTLDAETGKIESFNKYNGKSSRQVDPVLKIPESQKLANEALQYYLPDIYEKFKENAEQNEAAIEYWGDENQYHTTSRTFNFIRHENDIKVENENVNIGVNSYGEVISFSYNFTEDCAFESPDGVIGEEEAFAGLFAQKEPQLKYTGFITRNGKAKTYLVYVMGSYNLNAKTGKLSDYYGNAPDSPPAEAESKGYSDISGISTEKAINELYRHGITLETKDGKFEPDKLINEHEFVNLLDTVYSYPVPLRGMGDLVSPDGQKVEAKPLSRANSAKLFVTAMGGNDYAELKGIFSVPFPDVDKNSDNIGYIAIAYSMGAINPDSAGNFRPNAGMTRAQAMQFIYNILLKNTNAQLN